jgi:DNA-directed RNA polymerase specialized sigma24 family protein
LTPDEVSEVVRRYAAGESATALAAVYGVNRRTISAHLKRRQAAVRYRAPLDIDEANALYEQGWSLARVGGQLGVSTGTVLNAFQRAGIPTRPVGTNQWRRQD